MDLAPYLDMASVPDKRFNLQLGVANTKEFWRSRRKFRPAIQRTDQRISRKARQGKHPTHKHSFRNTGPGLNLSSPENGKSRESKDFLTASGHNSSQQSIVLGLTGMQHDITLDRVIACLLLPLVLPLLAMLFILVLVCQGRPFVYASERMRDADTSFMLYKIRTMHPSDHGDPEGALGGHQRRRVTPIGVWLRRLRFDELPQIFNVIRGDIRFIGPRPPLRKHVDACPRRYRRLLAATRPGITGLATVMVHAREERLLASCSTVEETELVYQRRCLPVKLRLDMIYQRNRSLGLDLLVLWRTFSRLVLAEPHKPRLVAVAKLRPSLRGV